VNPPTQGLARVPLLTYGFRPFFLGGAIWSLSAMPLWIATVTGKLSVATSYGAVSWHAHEFLFGYVGAIIAGFLLTAVPGWAKRPPIGGGALLALFALWAAGRAAFLLIDTIGLVPAATIDSLFLLSLAALVFRELIAGGDRRNLKVALLVLLLAFADIAFHLEIIVFGAADYALRATIAILVMLISLIGGRVTPTFTRNWLAKRQSKRLPQPFGLYDQIALAGGAIAVVLWVVLPGRAVTGWAMLGAGLLHAARLARWSGARTWQEPLVLVLHVGYAFLPLGFLLIGASILDPQTIPTSGALHAWTAGAIGTMTLAVMTRASLGHTGRPLTASVATRAIYCAVVLAALVRIAAPVTGGWSTDLLEFAAAAWTAAFAGFAAFYGPILLRPRL
jgi:uncharacterized protein involved in response to NO